MSRKSNHSEQPNHHHSTDSVSLTNGTRDWLAHLAGFRLDILPARLVFGIGSSEQLSEHIAELGIGRPLIIGTPAAERRHAHLFDRIADSAAVRFFEAEPHCPERVVERCRAAFTAHRCDGAIAVGGGSTLGLGKILAAEEGAAFLALPTTYSGSEMTPLYGRKVGDEKRVRRDPACKPGLVVYDPALTRQLPRRVAVTTGMNSLAHAVEALYAKQPSPLTTALAEQALIAHRDGLSAIGAGRGDDSTLSLALYGGLLGGFLVSACGTALHHQLCHVLGGLFDLPHGETNSVVLPHALAYNAFWVPNACAIIQQVFSRDDAAQALYDFAASIGAPTNLRDLGMPEHGIDLAVETILKRDGYNPRPLERAGLSSLVRNAFAGLRPDPCVSP